MAPPRSKPLVLALVGTDHHPFDRLVGWVDAWAAGARDARVVVQHGSARPPAHAEGVRVLPPDELSDLLSRATAVVCHGGPGTIAAVRAAGLLPIVVARDPSLGEHVDDHQMRFVRAADRAGEIRAVASDAALGAALDAAVAEPETLRIAPGTRDVAVTVERFGRLVDDLVTPRPGVRVLFVAGWGRSGSTLLDRMLGQVPGVFSAGELRDIWERGVVEDRLCGCGEAFHSCPVWRKVGETAFGGWDELDLRAVQRLRQRLDRPWSVPQLLGSRVSPSWDRDVVAYRAILARLYPAIAEVTGAQVIVDSSKIATFALLLRGIPGLDLRTVHLVRDPRGVVHSWRKAVQRDDGGGRDAMIRYGVVPAAARYVAYNGLAHGLRALGPYRFLRYEDLIAAPRGTVARVLAFAGVPAGGDTLGYLRDDEVDLEPNHTVDGNPMRMSSGPVALRRDDGWRTGLPPRDQRVTMALTAPLALPYGYGRR
jgi:UDP-N-acetylglucosamine transferase subunit ALG13